MCYDEDEYDDYEYLGETATLILNTRDIFTGNQSDLSIFNAVVSNEVGYMTYYGSKICFTNIDLQKVLGSLYDRYDVFSIDLKHITSPLTNIADALDANSSNRFRSISIYLEGLDFVNNRGMMEQSRAHLTNVSEQYNRNDVENTQPVNWWLAGRYLKEIQHDESEIFFRKHKGIRPITISIGSINETGPINSVEPQVVYGINIAPPLFCQFLIKPVY